MQSSPRRQMDKRVEDLGVVSASRRHVGKRVTLKRLGKLLGSSGLKSKRRA